MGSAMSGLRISWSCTDQRDERCLLSAMNALSHILLGSLRVGAPGGWRPAWAMEWHRMPGMLGAALGSAYCNTSARHEYLSRLHGVSCWSACSTPWMTCLLRAHVRACTRQQTKCKAKVQPMTALRCDANVHIHTHKPFDTDAINKARTSYEHGC